MPRLENPLTYKNVVQTAYTTVGGHYTEKDITEDVPTAAIKDYFNPVKQLPNDPSEASKTLVKLTLARGEIKDFSDEEAAFLMKKYPWVKTAHHKANLKPGIEEEEQEVKARPAKDVEINVEIA